MMADEGKWATKEEKLKRRKEIWDKMTLEEQQAAEKKKEEILKWSAEESDKIIDELKEEGRFKARLGVDPPELMEHHRQYKKRLYDLLVSIFGEENMEEWEI